VGNAAAPSRVVLRAAAPNPFASRTAIGFSLPRAGTARLAVYDAAGRLVRTLVNGERPAGPHEIVWDATDGGGRAVRPGTYFMRLEAAGTARTRSVVVLR
jgi:flagellar hook assembly protein FlgD